MNRVAVLNRQDRMDLFRDAADRKGVHPGIVEKDFWVCWTLKQLFAEPSMADGLVFKGGTTLSKVYRIIERFSEDIDLTIDKSRLGFVADRDPEQPGRSGKQVRKLLDEMKEICHRYVVGDFQDNIRRVFAGILAESEPPWSVIVDDQDPDGQTLLFYYPASIPPLEYIQPCVRIECGCRSDPWPTTTAEIVPYAAEYHPDVFADPSSKVSVLTAERTFWEKATILHQEFHRDPALPMPPRYARHYYDLAMLAGSSLRTSALEQTDLLARVVKHKTMFFRCAWARYDEAVPGRLKISPRPGRIAELRRDYQAMSQMFFGTPPDFSEILDTLQDLEAQANWVNNLIDVL